MKDDTVGYYIRSMRLKKDGTWHDVTGIKALREGFREKFYEVKAGKNYSAEINVGDIFQTITNPDDKNNMAFRKTFSKENFLGNYLCAKPQKTLPYIDGTLLNLQDAAAKKQYQEFVNNFRKEIDNQKQVSTEDYVIPDREELTEAKLATGELLPISEQNKIFCELWREILENSDGTLNPQDYRQKESDNKMYIVKVINGGKLCFVIPAEEWKKTFTNNAGNVTLNSAGEYQAIFN